MTSPLPYFSIICASDNYFQGKETTSASTDILKTDDSIVGLQLNSVALSHD